MPFTRSSGDGVATITFDDGKVNAFDLDFFADLNEALDASASDDAVVLVGRPGMFSAGLNMKVMTSGDVTAMTELLVAFGRTMLRVWTEPRAVVAAVTGHAVAGGTFLSMAADHSVAAAGEFRWGLIETTINFPLPLWGITLARGNLRSDRLDDLILPGRTVGPDDAVAVGFTDELADPAAVIERAHQHALELTKLTRGVYAETKRRLRGPAADEARAGIADDTAAVLNMAGL